MTRPLLPLLLLLAIPAAAEPLKDTATGLAITAPQGTVATLAPAMPPGPIRAVFDIRRPGETDTGCRVSTVDAPANVFLSQEELNQRSASAEYQQAMAAQLSTVYDLIAVDVIGHRGIAALGVIGDLRQAPGDVSPRVRSLLVFLDTPLQRVMLTCVADQDTFNDRAREFEEILDGLVMP
jgi:hypothetical protein